MPAVRDLSKKKVNLLLILSVNKGNYKAAKLHLESQNGNTWSLAARRVDLPKEPLLPSRQILHLLSPIPLLQTRPLSTSNLTTHKYRSVKGRLF